MYFKQLLWVVKFLQHRNFTTAIDLSVHVIVCPDGTLDIVPYGAPLVDEAQLGKAT